MAPSTPTEPPDPEATGPTDSVADRLADVAHEMRGPLGAVIALGDLLLARDLDAGDRRVVELIRLAGRHLLGLADDLAGPADGGDGLEQRAGARAKAGRAMPADMARSVAALYAPLLGAAGLRVAVEVAPGVPDSLPANETWLRQILVNFVSNALKFAATEVKVLVAVEGADVVFAVEDDGPGPGLAGKPTAGALPPARPDPVTGRAGSGRGLEIARRLAAALDGTLSLTPRPGGGTVARLRVPVERRTAAAPEGPALAIDTGPDAPPASPRPRTGRRRLTVRRRVRRLRGGAAAAPVSLEGLAVLVVDDSLVSRLLMLTILESFDMRVVAVTSGAEAEAEVRRRRPDLVCLDWTLDGETGESVRRRLEDSLGAAMPPAIAITGLATAPRLPEAGWKGGPVVAKPFSPRELHRAIEAALAPPGHLRAPGHGHPS